MLMLVSILVIMLLLLCMDWVLRMLRRIRRLLDMLLRYLLIDPLLLQSLADHLLVHLLVFVDDVQQHLLDLSMLVVVGSRAIDLSRLCMRARNVRLLAGTVFAVLRRALVGVKQDGSGLPTFLLADLLAG